MHQRELITSPIRPVIAVRKRRHGDSRSRLMAAASIPLAVMTDLLAQSRGAAAGLHFHLHPYLQVGGTNSGADVCDFITR